MSLLQRGIELKSRDQIRAMRRAGVVVSTTLRLLESRVAPGMTTGDLDALAATHIRDSGATPSFLGYEGFPATICVSVNDEVVHGIPGPRVLAEGDVVSIDCGAIVDGWHGDAAITVVLDDDPDPRLAALLATTEEAMWRGILAARVGGRLGDVSAGVERHVRDSGRYGIVEDFTGHGIGTAMHQPPDVPNVGRAGRGLRIRDGLVIAVEPMITLGAQDNVTLDDDWTVVTRDGGWAAHFEHTVAVTDDGLWVLTAPDGGAARLADAGVGFAGE